MAEGGTPNPYEAPRSRPQPRPGLFDRIGDEPAPNGLQICIVVQGVLFWVSSGIHAPYQMALVAFQTVVLGAGVTFLFALWRMRRWAVYALLGFCGLYLVLTAGALLEHPKVLIVAIPLRLVAVIAGLVYWKKLS
jgi:hypothetical protein